MPFEIELSGKEYSSIKCLKIASPCNSLINIAARIVEQEPRIWRNEEEYIYLKLTDYSDTITSCVWPVKYKGEPLQNLGCYEISGVFKKLSHGCIIEISDAIQIKDAGGVSLAPSCYGPSPEELLTLHEIVNSIEDVTIKQFINSVFGDSSIIIPFILNQASRSNHHSYPGGLLKHSIECAQIVKEIMATLNCSTIEMDIAVACALLHDVGKIFSHDERKRGIPFIHHDEVTLEVLGNHLKELDSMNMNYGTAIRYFLIWRNRKFEPIPSNFIGELIVCADRISSGKANADRLFEDEPNWKYFTRESNRLYWRLPAA